MREEQAEGPGGSPRSECAGATGEEGGRGSGGGGGQDQGGHQSLIHFFFFAASAAAAISPSCIFFLADEEQHTHTDPKFLFCFYCVRPEALVYEALSY
jgi:hypothetical protein